LLGSSSEKGTVVLGFVFTVLLGLSNSAFSADVGLLAPEFSAELPNRQLFSTTKLRGQVVLIHFWATWCDACEQEIPALVNMYQQQKNKGFQVLLVSQDKLKDQAQAKSVMQKWPFPSVFASDAKFKDYGRIWRLPLTFVIDRKGILQKDGWTEDGVLSQEKLEKVLLPLLAQPQNPSN